ncbi:GAF and ANTAR domain-containing protein [Streptomyces sp. SID13031]|uniref:GAF and ANTAR domain-containing protein n=1 Tax=Streptomyces sp. SID13031 TaxID=2706046 RepID=UPI0013C62C7A|nr:GAF and ANTAR domain-containing protein [Streptomyces sp. SID13031]NEA34434.1 GAF and ANTAR domain-containing protein [Streptomyces sp. SID13031]
MALIRSRVRRPSAVSAPTTAGSRPELTDAVVAAGEVARWAELHDAAGITETVGRVQDSVLRIVGGDCAGVILVHRGRLSSVGAVDLRAERADQLQVEYGEGPSVPLSRAQGSVLVPDTAADQRWPRWSRQVAELGLRSMLTVPLATTSSAVGAITVYAAAPNQFSAGDAAAALLLARHAAVAVVGVQEIADLARAIEARHLIGQAQGVLMERFEIDADQAFAVLRRYSQDGNVKLRVVAARLVASRKLPDGSADGSPAGR